MKREYTYETGIACDPNKRDSAEEDDDDLPLAAGGSEYAAANAANSNKNKARKPAPQSAYRN